MALVPCRECGHKVSTEANSWLFDWKTRHCPNCDCRNPTQDSHHSYSVFGSNKVDDDGYEVGAGNSKSPSRVWLVLIFVVVGSVAYFMMLLLGLRFPF